MQIQHDSVPFIDYLKQLPPAWVIEHFFSDTDENRKILSSAMIEDIAEKSMSQETLLMHFRSLGEEDQVRCAAMYLCKGMGCSTEAASGLDDPIVTTFLGYAARGPSGEIRLFAFTEFSDLLENELVAVLGKAGHRKSSAQPLPVWPWRCTNDIAFIASVAGKNLLLKKRSGKFGTVLLQQVKKLIHTAEFYKNDDLETLLKEICSFATHRDLFSENEEQYRCRPVAVAEWLSLPLDERIAEVEAWFVQHCGGWNIGLLCRLCGEAGEQWLSSAIFSGEDEAHVRSALVALRFAGILDVRKQGGELLFIVAPRQEADPVTDLPPVMVMPDFTVILPQESLPETVYETARFCRLDTLDKVYHGAVDKSVLIEALAAGMSSERVTTLLADWGAPENVIASVQEWIREFFRVAISSAPLLISSEERVTEQLAAFPELIGMLERIPAHAVFRILPGAQRQVTDLVRSIGFDERIPQQLNEQPLNDDAFVVPFMEDPQVWELITDSEAQQSAPSPTFRGSKYGTGLKELDMSETVQVIDYALLTGQKLVFTYEGSPYVRKGTYTVTPVLCSKGGAEPLLDAQLQRVGTRKQFYIKKISSIGVVAK